MIIIIININVIIIDVCMKRGITEKEKWLVALASSQTSQTKDAR